MKYSYFLSTVLALAVISCNKTEGPGGTSTLIGHVTNQEIKNGRSEITEVIFSPGVTVEHGDYWVINNPNGLTQFYIYYKNPTWVSEANPFLEGRTGIAVSFNYSDSNVELAQNTITATNSMLSPYFEITRNVDVLTFTAKTEGDAPDADKVSSPFEVNTSQQGKSTITGTIQPAIDEKVYIVYGDQEVYGDLTRTGGDGEYEFKNLTAGIYTLYAVSQDASTGVESKVSKTVEITAKKSVVDVPEITIKK